MIYAINIRRLALAIGISVGVIFFTAVPSVQAAIENGAQFVGQSVPASMTAGQSYSVSVTMKNTGTMTWGVPGSSVFVLKSQNPLGNTTWGVSSVPIPANTTVANAENAVFKFTVTAPATPDAYNFEWQMNNLNDAMSFGEMSPNMVVSVAERGIEYFNASPSNIYSGAVSMLSWRAPGARYCSGDGWMPTGGISQGGANEGSAEVRPKNTTTYAITCFYELPQAQWESRSAEVTVTVREPRPAITITANPATVSPGGPSIISWNAPGAQRCSGGDWLPRGGATGSVEVRPQSATTYIITCFYPLPQAQWEEQMATVAVTVAGGSSGGGGNTGGGGGGTGGGPGGSGGGGGSTGTTTTTPPGGGNSGSTPPSGGSGGSGGSNGYWIPMLGGSGGSDNSFLDLLRNKDLKFGTSGTDTSTAPSNTMTAAGRTATGLWALFLLLAIMVGMGGTAYYFNR